MNSNAFKSRVSQYAALRGYSMQTTAKMLGCSTATLYDRMNNQNRLSVDEINFICKKLGMSTDDKKSLIGILFNISI